MRHRNILSVGLAVSFAAALASCGSEAQYSEAPTSVENLEMSDIAEESAADASSVAANSVAEAADGSAQVPRGDLEVSDGSAPVEASVSAPKIAYVYDYGFRVDADEIASLAQAHVDLCEKLRDNGCRVVNLRQSGSEGSYASGRLDLAVAAGEARAFGKELANAAEGMGGEQIDVAISGEDLSKQMVDTEARLRARVLLRDRLMDVLRSRQGTVAELVEAERGVAQVNEEIDQARSWLTQMRGRVAFSQVTIEYNSSSRAGGSFGRPIAEAFQAMGAVMGTTIAVLLYGLAIAIPLLILLFALRWILHRFGLRLRWWRKTKSDATTEPVETET